jgi:hypothetical protein
MKFVAVVFALVSASVLASSSESSFTFGSRTSYFTGPKHYDNGLNFIHMTYKDQEFLGDTTFKRNFELRAFDPSTTDERVFIDPVNVSLELLMNSFSFQVGFLRYRFSETFGLQILDIANPRDYSDYVLNDLSWAKRSVFGLNLQTRWDRLETLWMLTLWSNGDRLPYRNTPFDLTDGNFGYEGGVVHRPWFKDYEYGVRLKYLFESGLDLSLLAYRHFVRPTYQTIRPVFPVGFVAELSQRMVNSLGMAGSFVIGDWVLRGDFLYTKQDTLQESPFLLKFRDHYQHLLGIDRIWENWTFGAQVQNDFTYERNFVGVKVENAHFEFWKPSVMAFLGDKNSDQWIQVKNAFELGNWNLSVIADFLEGSSSDDGLFGPYSDNDRLLIEISATY